MLDPIKPYAPMDNSIIQSISSILIVGVGIYLIYLKSYVQKKAENFATTRDIGKITQIVEETKKQFNSELELLRSNLNLYGQSFNSIKSLERNALIEIANKYSAWLNSLLNFNLIFYSYDFYEPLMQQPFILLEKHLEFDIAEDNLHLYLHDMEIINKAAELKRVTYELEGSVFANLSLFVCNCKAYSQKKQIAEELGIDKIEQIHKEYHEKQQPVIEKSLEERISIAKKIHTPHIDFIKILNYRIYQLIQGT